MKYFSHKIVWYLNIFSLQGPELSHIRDRARIWQLCRKVGKYFVKHIQHLIRSKQYAWENCRRSLVKHYWIQTDLSKKVRIWHLIFTFDWYSSGCNQTLCISSFHVPGPRVSLHLAPWVWWQPLAWWPAPAASTAGWSAWSGTPPSTGSGEETATHSRDGILWSVLHK